MHFAWTNFIKFHLWSDQHHIVTNLGLACMAVLSHLVGAEGRREAQGVIVIIVRDILRL